MAIRRWDPGQELLQLNDRLNRLFGLSRPPEFAGEEMMGGTWSPPCDILEDAEMLIVRAEMPGVKENDIDVRIENNTLTIRGMREFEKESPGRTYHLVERSYGRFARSFNLPNTIDPERVTADFKNGLLEVRIPKREETRPRQIKVEVETDRPVVDTTATEGPRKR